MKALLTKKVYVGATATKAIVIDCVEGQDLDPAVVKEYRDKLEAVGVIEAKQAAKHKEAKDGKAK